MLSGFLSNRCDVVSSVEEAGDFLLETMDSERVAEFNSNLQKRILRLSDG